MANEQEITFDEPDEGRDIYHEPDDRALIRTKDVYQTELDNGVEGYSETMLAIVANFKNAGKPEGFNVQSMVGKSKRGEVALRLFAVVDDSVADPVFVKVGFKSRGCLAMTGCASAICSMIEGKTFSQALELTPKDVELAVDGVPKGKGHTTLFAIEAVREQGGMALALPPCSPSRPCAAWWATGCTVAACRLRRWTRSCPATRCRWRA